MSRIHHAFHGTLLVLALLSLFLSVRSTGQDDCRAPAGDSGARPERFALHLEPNNPCSDNDFRCLLRYSVDAIPLESLSVSWDVIDLHGEVRHFVRELDFYDAAAPGTYEIRDALVVDRFNDRSLYPPPAEVRVEARMEDIFGRVVETRIRAGHDSPEQSDLREKRRETYMKEHPFFNRQGACR